MKPSKNSYDWLGRRSYFWENDNERALHWAEEMQGRKRGNTKETIKKPAVLGAVLCLGKCRDLLDSKNFEFLKIAYELIKSEYAESNTLLPQNVSFVSGVPLRRHLDRLVIDTVHRLSDPDEAFDSVRAMYTEGEEIYPTTGFREKNHIQICICNPNCIKGFFIPRDLNTQWNRV